MAKKTDIRLRRSNVLNAIPGAANLSEGELALNTNTGALYFKKSDSTIITAADNTIFHIDSDASNSGANKKIGIGTTSPEGLMHFAASSDYDIVFDNTSQEKYRLRHGTSGLYLTGPDTNTLAFGVDQNHDVRIFNTSGSAYATFDGSTSRVGIGTTSPSEKLHVTDTVFIDYPDGGGASLKIGRNDSSNYWEVNHAGADFRLYNTASSGSDILFAVDASGTHKANKVGIGNATPDKKLTVDGDIKIRNGDAFMSENVAGSTRSLISLGTDNILRIKGNDPEGSGNVISMINGGNVGIGTTSPDKDLHVAGDIKLTGTLFNGTRDEYTNSNLIRLNQRYTGGAVSGTSYFEANEYQKVVTVTPNGSSENYQVSGKYYVQSGNDMQTVNFVASLRSDVLPNLAWEIFYDQEDTGVRYIEPFLWTKETTTAGFILGFKVLTGSIFGSVTADINIIPRNADDKDNVSINTTVQSEQTTIDTGFTNRSFTLRKSVNNNLHGFGTNPAAGYRVDVNGNLKATALYADGYIYHTGDSDTYINYSTDNIILSAGGPVMHIKGSGRVGIGTSSPSEKFHVYDGDILLQTPSGSGGRYISLNNTHTGGRDYRLISTNDSHGSLGGGDFAILDNNISGNDAAKTRLLIDSSGNVGIGTSAPAHKLDVHGNISLTNAIPKILFTDSDTNTTAQISANSSHLVYTTATTARDHQFKAGSSTLMYIEGTGNVGIGTASPAKKLEVDFTGDTVGARFTRSDTTGSSTIQFANSAGVKSTIGFNAGTNKFDINHNAAVRLSVDNNGAVTFNEAFTFPSSIGNAGQILKVPSSGTNLVWADDAGGGSATVLTDTDGDTKIQVEEGADEDVIRFDTASSQRMVILANGNVGINNNSPSAKLTANGSTLLNLPSSSNTFRIQDSQNNVERLRVTQAGDVGIGTSSPDALLDLKGNFEGNSNFALKFTNTMGTGAVGGFRSHGTNGEHLTLYQEGARKQSWGENEVLFYGASDAEIVRFKHDGRVGINTASPTYSLHVNGDSNILLKIESTGTDQNARMIFSPSDGDKDWNLGANDNGEFTLYDAQNSRTPFSIAMGAASNSLTINSSGNVSMSQNLTVTGNLTVSGTTTTINTATLDVEDKNITLNYSSGDSSGSADGAGITIQDAVDASTDATFVWDATNDQWDLSHSLELVGDNRHIYFGNNNIFIGESSNTNKLELRGGGSGTGQTVYIDNSGQMGLGTSAPGQKLDVRDGTITSRDSTNANYAELDRFVGLTLKGNGTGDRHVKTPNADNLVLGTNNLDRVTILGSGADGLGYVGINRTAPIYNLDVRGKTRLNARSSDNSDPTLYIVDNSDDVGDQTYASIHLDYNISGSDTLATTDRSHRGMFLDIDSSASGGDTSNEHRIYGIDVDLDFNGDSDQVIGAQFHTENNNADSIQTQIFGLRSYAVNDTSGTARNSNTYGAWIQAQANHTTTQTNDANMTAIRARTLVSTSADGGRLNDLYGVYSEVEIDDPGQALDVDNVYVGRFTYNNDDGTNNNVSIDNAYLVFGNYDGGAASTGNSYGIYMSSNVPKHYFGSNVGIGTTSPDALLEVSTDSDDGTNAPVVRITNEGNTIADGAVIGTLQFVNKDTSSGPHIGHIQGIANSSDERSVELAFATGFVGTTTERLRISQNGYVGIGTNSPAGNLHIKSIGNVGDALLIIEADADNNVETDNPRIELRQDNNLVAGYIYMEGTGGATATGTIDNSFVIEGKANTGDNGSPIHFATGGLAPNQSGGPTNGTVRMTVHEQGNIGIGTTAPADKLHIGGAGNLLLERGGEVRSKDTGGTVRTIARIDGSNNLQYGYSGSGLVQFMGGGSYTERIRIHTNGNIAINHDAAPHTLTVNGTISRVNSSGIQVINLQTNNDAGQIAINNSGGTQRIRLDSNGSSWFMGGSVGIGDSSPSSKLHVVGAVQNASLQDYGIAAFENTNLEGLSIGYDADGGYTYLYSREVGVSSRGLHLNGSIFVDNYAGPVGIGTVTPNNTCSLEIYKNGANSVLRIHDDAGTHAARVHLRSGGNDAYIQLPNTSNALEFRTEGNISTSNTAALKIQTNGRADFGYAVRIEEYQIDTTETSTAATTQAVIHSFAAATFRSARYTVQVTNSTDSAYHTTELLLVHDGTTANITEFGTIFTGAAAEATFDADINSGNVRLLATPASGDSMEFKVIAHSVTV